MFDLIFSVTSVLLQSDLNRISHMLHYTEMYLCGRYRYLITYGLSDSTNRPMKMAIPRL